MVRQVFGEESMSHIYNCLNGMLGSGQTGEEHIHNFL
jgi:hypothetical protein